VKYKIYILFSETFKRTYVGFSEDPSKRLEAHNSGKVISTKKYMPWRIVYLEEFSDYNEVRKKEKYYKSGAGRRKIRVIFDELGLNN